MKVGNSWRNKAKQWDKVQIRLRIGKIDFFTIELDKSRVFYMFTILNFTIKNR